MVGTERINIQEEDLRLYYFKKFSSNDAKYAEAMIEKYKSLRNALAAYDANPAYSQYSKRISELINVEEKVTKYTIDGQKITSLLDVIKKFEPEREDTVIIDKSELEKRLNKSEE
jgi:predicted HAD superfamily phosphohydrolase